MEILLKLLSFVEEYTWYYFNPSAFLRASFEKNISHYNEIADFSPSDSTKL